MPYLLILGLIAVSAAVSVAMLLIFERLKRRWPFLRLLLVSSAVLPCILWIFLFGCDVYISSIPNSKDSSALALLLIPFLLLSFASGLIATGIFVWLRSNRK